MAASGNRCVKGRFAPSPSGRMHMGNVFSALLAWLSARSQGGEFVIRLEDIDERCQNPRNARLILEDLAWLGLDWDEEPLSQKGRNSVYQDALDKIAAQADVYPCFCSRADLHAASAPHASDGTPIYAGTCRSLTEGEISQRLKLKSPALRVAVPGEVVSFTDRHLGEFSQNLALECGDFVLRRSDGAFAYQLVVVVDDAASGVTEVVRGDDLVGSTPRQVWLHRLLGLEVPSYAHHPMLLAPDGKRLSKRERGLDMGVMRDEFSSQELVGRLAYLAGLLDGCEPATPQELVDLFQWERVPCRDIVLEPRG